MRPELQPLHETFTGCLDYIAGFEHMDEEDKREALRLSLWFLCSCPAINPNDPIQAKADLERKEAVCLCSSMLEGRGGTLPDLQRFLESGLSILTD
ncbi:MAG: hypothetical protein N4A71_02445 [Carboxylicivirga sp.]|jgi:hypothetical protein|nr:hypothetical protein [Carboxylicivirga sp.]